MSIRVLRVVLAALAFAPVPARASVGLSSGFSDVVLENLEPGGSYDLRARRGLPYSVTNRGDAPADVAVEVQAARPEELAAPYEPIPSATWIELTPRTHRLAPGETAFSDLIIRVPADPALAGRHFQATLWARTTGTGLVGAGVKGALRLSVGPAPKSLAAEAARKGMVDLDYELRPAVLRVSAGRKAAFALTNRSKKTLTLSFAASGVSFEPASASVAPGRSARVWVAVDGAKAPKEATELRVLVALPGGTVVNDSHRVIVEPGKRGRR